MKTLTMAYGKGEISLPFPPKSKLYSCNEPEGTVSRLTFMQELSKLFSYTDPAGPVAIVVADSTRLCGYPEILPWVSSVLQQKGVDPSAITFYIAYGTHPRQGDAECRRTYGQVYDKYRFIHHDCTDVSLFAEIGRSSRGTPVLIRKDLLQASLILTIGAVSHHYFAGYGGGRKLLFPGLGARTAIYRNHMLFLDKVKGQPAEGCQSGKLRDNPLAEDLFEIHTMMPPYISIHGILDSHGQPAQYFFGSNYEDFQKVCGELDRYYMTQIKECFPLVVVSAGGYPKDINFIQAHKTIHNAARLVCDGGTLIVLAECIDDIGSTTFLPYFEMGGRQQAFDHLAENYAGNGGTALAMMEKTARINIRLVSRLDSSTCRRIGIKKLSAKKAGECISTAQDRVAFIENGSLLVPINPA